MPAAAQACDLFAACAGRCARCGGYISTRSRPSRWAVGSPSVTQMICLFAAGCLLQVVAGELQARLDVREVLRHELRRIVERHAQEHPAVEDAHRLGRRMQQAALRQRRRIGVEADDLERVLRDSGCGRGPAGPGRPSWRGRTCRSGPSSRTCRAAAPWRSSSGTRSRRRRSRPRATSSLPRRSLAAPARALADDGVLQRLVQVEVRDRIAELVGLAVLVADLAGALEVGRVLAERVLARDREELFEGLVLDAAHAAWARRLSRPFSSFSR